MKFNKAIILTCLLLAVLTIGAVSASQDTQSNETLTQTDQITQTID